jgi:threonyl-tRNA synthetase
MMLKIALPDGSTRTYRQLMTCRDVAADIGPGLEKAAIAAELDGKIVGLDMVLPGEGEIGLRLLTKKDPESLDVMRHSAAHVMARAVMRLFDGVQLAFGPTIEDGFYYDFEMDHVLCEDDFAAIEKEMGEIIKLDEPFDRLEEPISGAVQLCREMQQPLKIEHIETGLAQEQTLSFYRQGEFLDLCRGPHVRSAKVIGKAYKLLSVAGAYWKADHTREQLQRVYATAFWDKESLAAYLQRLQEARQRDHRVLGRKLGLFEIDEKVGQGLILWKPKGALIRQQLQDFILEHLQRQGYRQVFTPHIGRLELYKTSGHYPYYSESQFPPLIDPDQIRKLADENCSCADLASRMQEGTIDGYMLKPMNCPHHIRIYASEKHSYRDLPIRLAEFGTVYRWEQSGEIGGLTRVRGFTQDDAHLFVSEDQLGEEVAGCIELVKIVFGTLGMDNYRVRVGLRDEDGDKYVGDREQWAKAEAACLAAVEKLGVPFSEELGEAAFYGPKIDFVVRDVLGREWQLGTVQVDYQLPERFDLTYVGADNALHRPVMIHRAPFGSMERFIGVLIEHFGGAFPLWLAPEQVRICTVSEKSEAYGRDVEQQFQEAGLRTAGDYRPEKLGAKIRNAQLEKIPYTVVVGPRDETAATLSLRDRVDGSQETMPVEEAIEKLLTEARSRVVRETSSTESVELAADNAKQSKN